MDVVLFGKFLRQSIDPLARTIPARRHFPSEKLTVVARNEDPQAHPVQSGYTSFHGYKIQLDEMRGTGIICTNIQKESRLRVFDYLWRLFLKSPLTPSILWFSAANH